MKRSRILKTDKNIPEALFFVLTTNLVGSGDRKINMHGFKCQAHRLFSDLKNLYSGR